MVTIDAMGTQTDIPEQIVQQGGDYLLAVKGNHKTMLQDLGDVFAGCDAVRFVAVPHDTAETVDKGHSRLEIRCCQTLADPQYLNYVRRQTKWKCACSLPLCIQGMYLDYVRWQTKWKNLRTLVRI